MIITLLNIYIKKLSLPNLTEISIAQNPVIKKMGYRYTLIIRLPKLSAIDGNEITSDEKEKAIVIYYILSLLYHLY